MIMSWLENRTPMQVVSPTWLTPQWVQRSPLPTKGIHPEWSIGLLDRHDFKGLDVVKKFGLSLDWKSQCKNWEDSASVFIGTKELYEKCSFSNFKAVTEFSEYPLKVWVKQE